MVDVKTRHSSDALDLTVKKPSTVLPSPPSSTSSSSTCLISSTSIKRSSKIKQTSMATNQKTSRSNKRPLRFQCKFCDYKAPSTSLMQNHIYRHTDATPYACAYCGHKSTTKSTIMVHIELCHPNMEVKIIENRVREQDFYYDLNGTDVKQILNAAEEPPMKKRRHSNSYDNDATPINGVAISLKAFDEDSNDLSPISDQLHDLDETQNSSELTPDIHIEENEQSNYSSVNHTNTDLKLKVTPPSSPKNDQDSVTPKESDTEEDSEYLVVYNRPKQFYGSLYEPDKQYACRLCTYTTNHRPSMEDHVFVHTNERPYKCGYCGEEIYTRYAATYHIKYKHPGMERNFIQNKADVTKYYVNRAKKEEVDQLKTIDTRRVKVPKAKDKHVERQERIKTPAIDVNPSDPVSRVEKTKPKSEKKVKEEINPTAISSMAATSSTMGTNENLASHQNLAMSQYPMFLLWSYYMASQNPLFGSMMRQQTGQQLNSLLADPETVRKFLQMMQNVANPSNSAQQTSEHRKKKNSSSKK